MVNPVDGLSPREREIMNFVARGLTNRQIATRLQPPCAAETVKSHLSDVFLKLGAKNRAEAAAVWSRLVNE